jgi:hypothetical protein
MFGMLKLNVIQNETLHSIMTVAETVFRIFCTICPAIDISNIS